jgi:glycosyltransferase involved in cell wall biosynthesis
VVLLVDISRLVENLHLATPTGIDRVEMAYAQHFLARAATDDVRFVVTWPHFSGVLKAQDIKPVIDETAKRWSGEGPVRSDQSFEALRAVLNEPIDYRRDRPQRIGVPDDKRQMMNWRRMAMFWLRSVAHRLDARAIAELRNKPGCYIHVSQFRLNRPERFAWLSDASMRSIFMLHDLIPITHPEYCRPGEATRHRARVDTMLRHATRIVTVSDATRRALESYGANEDKTVPSTNAVTLGLTPIFLKHHAIQPVSCDIPYFVVVGTIEPRKNLLYLLTLWHRWTQEGRNPRARLVVVGRRGWENENILELLDRSKGLAPSVIEAASLGDAGMVALLKGAAALLAPSFVEGYGLPIAETLALGTPVLASDTDAHREAGGSFAEYLDPLDGPGWMRAFDDYSQPRSERRQKWLRIVKDYQPVSWNDHMQKIEKIIEKVVSYPVLQGKPYGLPKSDTGYSLTEK